MEILFYIFVFTISSFSTFSSIQVIIPRLETKEIFGEDKHKPGEPKIPEMGGLAIAAGFNAGVFLTIGLSSFTPYLSIGLSLGYAAFTVTLVALLGIADDIFGVRQWTKALIPLVAAVPLMAIKAGQTSMKLPFIGQTEFGIFYPLILVPLGVTGAANAVNMLAGFNGLETGMGLVTIGALASIAYIIGAQSSFFLLLAAIGALLVTLYYNWYPAKILIGDVGTLSIGAIIAAAVILGNFETAGIIIIIPYLIDLFIKAINKFPKSFGDYNDNDGKLYCPEDGPVGLAQLIMKITSGITERNLVLTLMGIEAIFGILAVLYYV